MSNVAATTAFRSFWGSSTKVEKGLPFGWVTRISYLTPGGALCPWASPGCIELCLGKTSGHFQAPKGAARQAQAARAAMLAALLHSGGVSAAAKAYVAGLGRGPRTGWSNVALRVNGTSDLPALADAVAKLAASQGITARFYDYTKSVRAALAWGAGRTTVHRTFSLSENNRPDALRVLAAGVNVAAVVHGGAASQLAQDLARALGAAGVIDGDQHDLRFLDHDARGAGPGWLVVLAPKGARAQRTDSGFVVRAVDVSSSAA
jgi:hypothetical protein